jgi:hypothetical protein
MGRVALSGSRRRAGVRGEYDILSQLLVETLDGHRYSKCLFEWMRYVQVGENYPNKPREKDDFLTLKWSR